MWPPDGSDDPLPSIVTCWPARTGLGDAATVAVGATVSTRKLRDADAEVLATPSVASTRHVWVPSFSATGGLYERALAGRARPSALPSSSMSYAVTLLPASLAASQVSSGVASPVSVPSAGAVPVAGVGAV